MPAVCGDSGSPVRAGSVHATRLEPILPAMLYTTQEIAAGYTYAIPLKQYNGSPPEHGWSLTAGFTADSGRGKEIYLTSHIDAPAANRETASGISTYWIGLGSYSIRVAISDDTGGVCRKDWTEVVGQSPKSGRGALFGSTMGGVFIPAASPAFDFRTQAILSHSKISLGTPADTVREPAHIDRPPASLARIASRFSCTFLPTRSANSRCSMRSRHCC